MRGATRQSSSHHQSIGKRFDATPDLWHCNELLRRLECQLRQVQPVELLGKSLDAVIIQAARMPIRWQALTLSKLIFRQRAAVGDYRTGKRIGPVVRQPAAPAPADAAAAAGTNGYVTDAFSESVHGGGMSSLMVCSKGKPFAHRLNCM